MSAVLEAIKTQHSTDKVKRVTQALVTARQDLHWRYDLSSSRRFPVQYYATALRGSGMAADEVLVIGIECFLSDEGPLRMSASITGEDGEILAESSVTEIDFPCEGALRDNPREVIGATAQQIQEAFDSLVAWVNARQDVMRSALAQA
jgi:hypothetical protein